MNARVLKKLLGFLAAAVVTSAAACIDMSAPAGEPTAISQVQLASLFIVRGDTLRDSLGHAAKPTIITFDGNGNPVDGFTASFFLTDSLSPAQLSDGFLIAKDTAGSSPLTGRIIGQVGSAQTMPLTFYVVSGEPSMLVPTLGAADTIVRITSAVDSAASTVTLAIQARVLAADSAAIPGAFVRFELVDTLASRTSSPAAFLRDDANRVFRVGQASPDTTDTNGRVSRTLVVVGSLAAISGRDSVDVVVTAGYRGTPLANSPLRIRVPIVTDFGQ